MTRSSRTLSRLERARLAVDDPTVIDMVATKDSLREVRLVVADHLPWDDEHAVVFRAKLSAYMEYIASGRPVGPAGWAVVVYVRCKFPPRPEDGPMLREIEGALERLNAGFLIDHRE